MQVDVLRSLSACENISYAPRWISEGMVSSILTTTSSASSDSDFRLLTAYRLGAETPSPPMIFLLSANLGGIGKDFVGLDVCRGTAGMNTVMTTPGVLFFGFSSRLPRFQFVVTPLTAISIAWQLVLSSCSGPSGLLLPWTRLWAGRLDTRLSPGHHSRVVVLVSSCVPAGLHVIPLWTNKSCQKRRVSNTMADGSYTREGT